MNLADVIRSVFNPDALPPRLVAGPPEAPAPRPLPKTQPESWDDLDDDERAYLGAWTKCGSSR